MASIGQRCAAALLAFLGAAGADEPVELGSPAPLSAGPRAWDRMPPANRDPRPFREEPGELLRAGADKRGYDFDDALPGLRPGDAIEPPPVYERYTSLTGGAAPFRVDYTLLGRGGVHAPDGGSVLMQELSFRYQVRFPASPSLFLRLQPIADIAFLQGPAGTALQLPPQLYRFAVDVEADFRIGDNWLISAAITPGFWTSLDNIDGFRLPARVLAAYKFHEGLYLGGGLIYTDNYYRNLLPTIGMIWDVTDRLRLELVAPRGRLVYRLHDDYQFYTGLEGGGDTYTIRSYGERARMQYRDLRWLIGAEVAAWRGVSVLFEAGYVFNRRIRIENQPHRNLGDSFFVRGGLRF